MFFWSVSSSAMSCTVFYSIVWWKEKREKWKQLRLAVELASQPWNSALHVRRGGGHASSQLPLLTWPDLTWPALTKLRPDLLSSWRQWSLQHLKQKRKGDEASVCSGHLLCHGCCHCWLKPRIYLDFWLANVSHWCDDIRAVSNHRNRTKEWNESISQWTTHISRAPSIFWASLMTWFYCLNQSLDL